MSRTPDPYFRGKTICNVCTKKLTVNTQAVTYIVDSKTMKDLIFCAPCATKLVMSVAQDISNITPEEAFRGYGQRSAYLEIHASAIEDLAKQMRQWADCLKISYSSYDNVVSKK